MGEAAARLFAEEGAKVVAGDVTVGRLSEIVDEITAAGGDAMAFPLDVSSAAAWADVVATTIERYGKIDILVNNAGIHTGKGILECDEANWNKVIGINAMGVWLGMKAVIPHMQDHGGSIVNTSSIAAILGGPGADAGDVAYSASKGAVRAMTKHAAQWFGQYGIRVNSVHPGAIFTGLARAAGFSSREEMGSSFGTDAILEPHIGEPLDIAYAYLYLASDESKFVTGEELVVDGGQITR
jgi:NAD(P)-dependent dehydrogenase (short-subunit alcohol dehydrogenase family)